ncbi:hypothetical protein GW17_00037027 [Ensete ventricosum]|nr:hypothetical protein GW17_00037027 [Ensete ventricosum]
MHLTIWVPKCWMDQEVVKKQLITLAVAGTRTALYRAVPPKLDHWRLISAVGGRLREKSGRLREKREEEEKKTKKRRRKPSACSRSRIVVTLACGSLARRRPRIAGAPSAADRRCIVARGSPALVAARTRARRKIEATSGNFTLSFQRPFLDRAEHLTEDVVSVFPVADSLEQYLMFPHLIVLVKVCNFDLYRPVLAVHTGPPGYRCADRPLPRGSVNRLKKKSTVGGRLRKKREEEEEKKKKIRGEERIPRPRAVLARLPSPPAGRPLPRPLFLPREETD